MASPLIPAPAVEVAGSGAFTVTANTPIVVPSGNKELLRTARYFSSRLDQARGLRLAIGKGACFLLTPDGEILSLAHDDSDAQREAAKIVFVIQPGDTAR